MKPKSLGAWGEEKAAEHLQCKGYKIIETGYRSRFGEIDLIAADQEFLVFVEVKTRKNAKFAEAREFVHDRKQEKVRATAELWLAENETELQPRFDVIEIYAPQGMATSSPKIVHLEDAF